MNHHQVVLFEAVTYISNNITQGGGVGILVAVDPLAENSGDGGINGSEKLLMVSRWQEVGGEERGGGAKNGESEGADRGGGSFEDTSGQGKASGWSRGL